jgi:hypothetical protein
MTAPEAAVFSEGLAGASFCFPQNSNEIAVSLDAGREERRVNDPGFVRWWDDESHDTGFTPTPDGLLGGLEPPDAVSGLSLIMEPKDIATIPGLPQHVYDDAARYDLGSAQNNRSSGAAHDQAWDSLSRYAQSAVAHDEAQTSLANYADLLTGSHSVDIPQRHWSVKDSSVILSPEMEGKIDPVAQEFYDRTARDLVVTDGHRTPADQAQRMYDKFAKGDKTTYVGPSGREIRSIYDTGMAGGMDKVTILNNMSSKIGEQMTNGHFVSKHLQDRAVDFQDMYLTPQQRDILGSIIRSNAGIALPEGIPRHTHASFPRSGR